MVNGNGASAEEANGWNPWYGPLALVIGFVASIITGVVVLVIGHSAGSSLTKPTPAVTDVGTFVEEVGFVLSAVWVASWVARPRPAQFGLRRPRIYWLKAAASVPVAYLVFLLLSALWSAFVSKGVSEKYLVKDVGAHSGAGGVLASCLVLCVVAPFCEEFLFRGFIFGALRNWRGPVIAAVLTGVLFGAIHLGSAPVADLVPLAIFGMLLCGLRQLTGSLYPGIALHSLNNAAALVVNADWSFAAFVAVLVGSLSLLALLVALGQRSLHLQLV
ncbi:MAG TPA: CPBP family intramembrane glutamic endopeptidase [Solirubrobacteraceae bacterium]|nr:CPBP family intramembrane glutamic endopeptidase [Solirubrobacteraceae bacterium]